MLAVLYAVIRERRRIYHVCDVFHVLLGRTVVFGLRTKT